MKLLRRPRSVWRSAPLLGPACRAARAEPPKSMRIIVRRCSPGAPPTSWRVVRGAGAEREVRILGDVDNQCRRVGHRGLGSRGAAVAGRRCGPVAHGDARHQSGAVRCRLYDTKKEFFARRRVIATGTERAGGERSRKDVAAGLRSRRRSPAAFLVPLARAALTTFG